MREILLTLQYICIIGLFVESLIIFRRLKNSLHLFLLLSCICAFATNLGYLMEIMSDSEDKYILALKLSYAGRIWYAFFLFLFVARLCRRKVPKAVTTVLAITHIFTFAVILDITGTTLYYSSYRFDTTGLFPKLYHGNGILHHVHMGLQVFYIVLGLTWLIIAFRREKKAAYRNRIGIIIVAVLVEGVFFLIQLVGLTGHTEVYDFTMFGYFMGTVIMLIAIFSFDLLGTRELAREYMIDRISEGIIAVDNDGIVQFYNEPAKALYPDITEEPDNALNTIRNAIAAGENLNINDRIYSPEESELVYKGQNYGKVYAIVDDTDHFVYLEELEKEKDRADRANEAKSQFLANMSHEIRTPINAVLGMDEMILRETRESAIRSYAADIMAAGKALLALIGDILDLSKVEEGKMEIIPVQYELSSLINDLVNMIQGRADKKGLVFKITSDEHVPDLLIGDEIRIRQCLLNLLTNAVKYTEKGSVTMDVSFEKKDENSVVLHFSVTDTGIGMRKEDMEALFSPYIRIDEKRNRTIEGTGLGMSITRRLLELMDSSLKVESEYGKGSKFSFDLCQEVVSWNEMGDYVQRYNSTRDEAYDYQELFHAPQARLLVVDDTEMNLTVVKNLLKKTGIQIDTVMSGKDALTLAGVNEYDVIFIDHMMPDMDGIETLQCLRKLEKNSGTPAVALTANAISGARQMYMNAGFNDYISKPIDGVKLEKLLFGILPKEKVITAENAHDIIQEKIMKDRSSVMVIDDDETVCSLVESVMSGFYDTVSCLSGKEAVSMAKKHQPDMILLDIHLKDSNGFTVMHELKKEELTSDIPVLLITGDNDDVMEEKGFMNGAADYIRKPFSPEVLRQRAKRIIDLSHYQKSIEAEVLRQTSRSNRLSREIMLTLSRTVDIKDHYTDGHSRRVAAISAEIARRLGKSVEEQNEQYEIGLLHDIGKIGIHDDIIHKTTRLSDDEFKKIKDHTIKGYEILKEIQDIPKLWEGARWHHERYDGSGYPDGLAGENIPEVARIVCIADCYDAMTSTRTYSEPRKQEDVRAEIARCSGTWFDPRIAETLLAMIDEDKDYHMTEKSTGSDVWKGYDRFWKYDGTVNSIQPAENELPEWLSGIQELDVVSGLKNCGSVEGYISVLSVFHQTAPDKAAEIREFWDNKDIENYTIRVHALKSSARIIGMAELSKLAESLEMAGKRSDTEYIKDNNDRLLAMYKELDDSLSAMDEGTDPGNTIDRASLKDAYNTIIEVAGTMDYSLMEELLKGLREYELPSSDSENIREVEKLLTQLDWEGIENVAKRALDSWEDS